MRFNKLTLKSFLSFKDETVIDFQRFGNKLMLLFGGSGVGKTAIFDGISFALYGKGSGKDRCAGNVEDYHSDFAKTIESDGSVSYRAPMLVMLEFEHDGKSYLIKRTIEWKNKGKGKGFDYEISMEFPGTTMSPIEETKRAPNGTFEGKQNDKVTEKVMEMIGLNADQFSQVVILAQGEFAKFLNADAKKREEILTKLVDNEDYVDFQTRLREMKNHLKKLIADIDREIAANLAVLHGTTIEAEEKELYVAGNPTLLADMQNSIDARNTKIAELTAAITVKEQEQGSLNTQKGAADEFNDSYDKQVQSKAVAEKNLAKLQQSIDIEKLKQALATLEILQQVLPKQEAAKGALQELEANNRAIEQLKKELADLQEEIVKLEQAKNKTAEENNPKIESLNGIISKLEAAIKVYPELDSANTELKRLEKKNAEAEKASRTAQENYDKAVKAIEEAEQELANLGNAETEELRLKKSLSDAKAELEKYTKLKEAVEATNKAEANYKAKQALEEQAKSNNDSCKEDNDIKQQEYFAAERQFQAGSLANKVRERVKELQLEDVECPVCHTKHKVANLNQWEDCAVSPAKTAWDLAQAAYEEATKAYIDAKADTKEASGGFKNQKTTALTAAQELFGAAIIWESINDLQAAGNPLVAALASKEQEKQGLEAELEAIALRAKQQKELNSKLKTAKEKLPGLKQAAETKKTSWEAAAKAVNEQNTKLAEIKGRLTDCPATLEAANTELKKQKKDRDNFKNAIERANQAFGTCEKTISEKKGQLRNAEGNKTNLVNKQASCSKAYQDSLFKCGWNETVYMEALGNHKTKQGEGLSSDNIADTVKGTRDEVDLYTEKERDYKKTIKDIATALKDKERIDTTELETKLEAVNDELKAKRGEHNELTEDKNNIDKALKAVGKLVAGRAKKQKVYNRVNPLADAANGDISFNRYVLNDLFCTMLDKANDRLNELCQGQYELKPLSDSSDSSNKGLNFTVYDCINQSHRESGSNSGGEKFEISLSLALGLSDIVQSCSKKASRIECLYIDEGFGTLGKEELEKTKRLLLNLSGGNRQIGIISHNTVLEEAIKNQIIVTRDKQTREGTKVDFKQDC